MSPTPAGHSIRGAPPRGLLIRRRGLRILDLAVGAAAVSLATLAVRRYVWVDIGAGTVGWLSCIVLAGAHTSSALRTQRAAVTMFVGAIGLTCAIMIASVSLGGSWPFIAIWLLVTCVFGLGGRALFFVRMDRSPVSLALAIDEQTLGVPWQEAHKVLGRGYRVAVSIDPVFPGFLDRLASVLTMNSIDQVVLGLNGSDGDFQRAVEVCEANGAEALTIWDLYEDITGQCMLDPTANLRPLPRSIWHVLGSRLVDIVAGLFYIPVALITVPLSRIVSGSALVSVRIRRQGDSFGLYAFRQASRSSSLMHRLLAWELLRFAPSFPALLTGRLALIGPSPIPTTDPVGQGAVWDLRYSVRPGITGWALINGCPSGPDALPYDLYYVRHRSLGFDLAILARTIATPLLSWRALSRALSPPVAPHEEITMGATRITTGEDLVSVVVPAYREGGRIEPSLALLVNEMELLRVPFEIVVVSDGSDDGTQVEARHAQGPITVIHYPENRGKGYALRRGLSQTRGSRVVFIDADMELHPQGIGRLLALLDAGADAAIGSKRHPESAVHYPWTRRVQSAVFQWMVRQLFGLSVTDSQSGIKAFRGPLLKESVAALTTDGFAFDLELLVELNARGAIVAEGPVRLDYRFQTTTGVSAVRDVLNETLRLWHRRRAASAAVPEISRT